MNAERNVDTELPDVGFDVEFDVDILSKKNSPEKRRRGSRQQGTALVGPAAADACYLSGARLN